MKLCMWKSLWARVSARNFFNYERFREVVNSRYELPKAAEAPWRRRLEVQKEVGAFDFLSTFFISPTVPTQVWLDS